MKSSLLVLSLIVACLWGYETTRMSPVAQRQSAILQSVLDCPRLQWIFHPEVPGRVPVRISIANPPSDIILHKFGKPVLLVSEHAKGRESVIGITRLDISGSQAHVRLVYPVEGVVGEFTLEQTGSDWVVTHARVHER